MPLTCARTHECLVSTQTFSTNNLQVSSAACKHSAFQHFLSQFLGYIGVQDPQQGSPIVSEPPNQQRTDRCIRSLIEWI